MAILLKDEARRALKIGLERHGFRVNRTGDTFFAYSDRGKFELTFMPGNRRVLISQKSEIFPEWRGKGYGKAYLMCRELVAAEAGCNLLLATVRNDNKIEIHMLEESGWKRYNTRSTGVSLWGKEL